MTVNNRAGVVMLRTFQGVDVIKTDDADVAAERSDAIVFFNGEVSFPPCFGWATCPPSNEGACREFIEDRWIDCDYGEAYPHAAVVSILWGDDCDDVALDSFVDELVREAL